MARIIGLCATLAAAEAPIVADRAHAVSLEGLFNAVVTEGGIASERNIAYGPDRRHRLDIYRANGSSDRKAVLVFYYGGGWTGGERATYRFVGEALATRGYTTVIPDYRLYPSVQFPDFVTDGARAYAWVHRNITDTCGRARPIVVIGHSAGAYIAAMLALDARHLSRAGVGAAQPAALIGLAGPYAFDPTTWPSTKEIFSSTAANPDAARTIAFARAGAPPAFLLHGGDDTTVKLYNTRDLALALKAQRNAIAVEEYPGIGHIGLVMAIARPFRWRAPVLDDVVAFVDRHAGGSLSRTPCGAR